MKDVNEKKIAQTTKITLISFFLLVVIGGFLLNLPISNIPGKSHNLFDSIFMAAASACVAGLSVLNPFEQYTLFGKIVILALIQIGALGFIFIVSAIFLLMKRKLSYKDKISVSSLFR